MAEPPPNHTRAPRLPALAHHRLAIAALLAIAIAAPLLHLFLTNREMPASRSDLLPRWVGTCAALQGKDPYSADVLRSIQTAFYGRPLTPADHLRPQAFLYPAHVVILLAPLALLSWETTRLLFLFVLPPLLACSFWLCLQGLRVSLTPRKRAIAVGVALLSWPVIWGLRLQQLTLPVAALILIAGFLLAGGQQFVPGVLLAAATIKPQLVVVLLAWLLLWAGLRRQWTFIASFTGSLALLLCASERAVPGWFSRWWASIRNYTEATHTAPPLEFLLGHWIGLTITVLVVVSGSVALWRLRSSAAESAEFGIALSLALAMSVAIVPADPPMIYNYVLLSPACFILVFTEPGNAFAASLQRLAFAQLVLDFCAVPLTVVFEVLIKSNNVLDYLPFMDFLLPSLLTIYLVSEALHRKSAQRSGRREAFLRAAAVLGS